MQNAQKVFTKKHSGSVSHLLPVFSSSSNTLYRVRIISSIQFFWQHPGSSSNTFLIFSHSENKNESIGVKFLFSLYKRWKFGLYELLLSTGHMNKSWRAWELICKFKTFCVGSKGKIQKIHFYTKSKTPFNTISVY